MALEFVGLWSGSIQPGHEADHERFELFLRSTAGQTLLRKYSLTEYTMYRNGAALHIVFKSDKRTIIPGILRNKPLWPEFWSFEHAGLGDETGELVFHWARE